MYVKLSDKFEIESDANQFALYRLSIAGKGSKRAGQKVRTVVGYYGDMEGLLKTLPNRLLMQSEARNLKDAIAELKAMADEWKRQTRGLFYD